MNRPLLLTVPQVCEQLNLSRSFVYVLLEREVIPSIRIGKARRIPAEGLAAWVAREMQAQAADGQQGGILGQGAVTKR